MGSLKVSNVLSIFGQHLTILRQDAVIDHAVTLIGFGQEQKLAVATGEQLIWQELNKWHRRIDKWQAWACECKPFGPCRPFDKLDKLQSQLNVLLCLPSHLSCWGGSRRNSGLSKTPGANIGERQARDTWHRALIELCAFAAQVVTLSFQECQTPQISYDFLNIKLSITDFPDLTIFVDTHSSRVAEFGCYEKMMRNAAAGIDKHRKEAWQARPKCVTLVMISYDHGFFMWNFSVHFAHLRTRNSL